MAKYIMTRIVGMLPSIFLLVLLVVWMVELIPGDIIDIMLADSPDPSLQTRADFMRELGLDKPFAVRYATYMLGIIQGDFGNSIWTHKPVAAMIIQYAPPTIQMGVISIAMGGIAGIFLGVISALRQDSWLDYILRSVAIAGISVPNFAIATAVVIFPAILWGISPNLRYVGFMESPLENMKIILLPSVILSTGLATSLMRLMRTTMLDVLRQDYVRTARAKGLTEPRVVSHHAVRNAVIPVITLLGVQIAFLLGGSVIVETIFAIPGVGRLLVASIARRDYPIIQGIVVVIGMFVMFTNLLVDLSYGFLDPRIRIG